MNKNDLKLEIQRYAFAAHDMRLYLDTHPDDSNAFRLFRALNMKCQELKEAYQCKYGPLNAESAADYDSYVWLEGPWPWEKGGNA